MTGASGLHRDGTLTVLCWCGRETLRVSIFDVRAGRTGACDEDCAEVGRRWLEERAA